ncbi:hypothetical protein [Aquipseudomonas alcaligenes]|uniref:hypothetical protein n=1 Tax=Aquipseudomonas alcaligenes TaxID=43263 RepID=UPI000DFBD94E|nr:hypothetical protein [Pseudomonas alcaligenes]SUD14103.1 Uncharacterised protein [Pseudomonas alcaligenes]
MKKIAIFVEGMTEQELTIRLLLAIAGNKGITLEIQEQHKGTLNLVEIRQQNPAQFYILLVNCNTDNQVKSQIAYQHAKLTQSGYTKIIGLRDVFPHPIADLPKVQQFLSAGLPTGGTPIDIVLAVMEVEAWFIEETTHFDRVHKDMTHSNILAKGYDLQSTRGHDWPNPAATLDAIYSQWGMRYTKCRKRVERTLDALSLEEFYVNTRAKSPSLDQYLTSIETGLAL